MLGAGYHRRRDCSRLPWNLLETKIELELGLEAAHWTIGPDS